MHEITMLNNVGVIDQYCSRSGHFGTMSFDSFPDSVLSNMFQKSLCLNEVFNVIKLFGILCGSPTTY